MNLFCRGAVVAMWCDLSLKVVPYADGNHCWHSNESWVHDHHSLSRKWQNSCGQSVVEAEKSSSMMEWQCKTITSSERMIAATMVCTWMGGQRDRHGLDVLCPCRLSPAYTDIGSFGRRYWCSNWMEDMYLRDSILLLRLSRTFHGTIVPESVTLPQNITERRFLDSTHGRWFWYHTASDFPERRWVHYTAPDSHKPLPNISQAKIHTIHRPSRYHTTENIPDQRLLFCHLTLISHSFGNVRG